MNEYSAGSLNRPACRWGGPQGDACWHVGACGCAIGEPTWLYRWQPNTWWYPETDVTICDEDMPSELRPPAPPLR